MGASAAASKDLVILSAAKNPGSFSAQTDATPTTDRSQRTPDAQANVQLDAKTCASANPGFFASIQNDMERFAQISQKQGTVMQRPPVRARMKVRAFLQARHSSAIPAQHDEVSLKCANPVPSFPPAPPPPASPTTWALHRPACRHLSCCP